MTKSRLGDVFALIDVIDRTTCVLSLYVRLKRQKQFRLVDRTVYSTAEQAREAALEQIPDREPLIIRNHFE